MRKEYDIVIVDSSPLLAVTDPSIIGTAVDGILLVVQTQSLKHNEAERAMEILSTVVAPTLGLAVNRLTKENLGSYGRGYGTYGNPPPTEDAEDHDEHVQHSNGNLHYQTNGHSDSTGLHDA